MTDIHTYVSILIDRDWEVLQTRKKEKEKNGNKEKKILFLIKIKNDETISLMNL